MLAIGYQHGLYFGQIFISILLEERETPHFGPRTHFLGLAKFNHIS